MAKKSKKAEYDKETGELDFSGDTQLVMYECQTEDCPYFEIQYQIRESVNHQKPILRNAHYCDAGDGCGKARKRLVDSVIPE